MEHDPIGAQVFSPCLVLGTFFLALVALILRGRVITPPRLCGLWHMVTIFAKPTKTSHHNPVSRHLDAQLGKQG